MGSAQPRACTHRPDGAPSPSSSPSAQGLLQTRAGGSEHTGPSAWPCSEGRPRRHQHRQIGDICRAHHTQQTQSRGLQRLVRAGPQCASGACAACPQLARGHSRGAGLGRDLEPPPPAPASPVEDQEPSSLTRPVEQQEEAQPRSPTPADRPGTRRARPVRALAGDQARPRDRPTRPHSGAPPNAERSPPVQGGCSLCQSVLTPQGDKAPAGRSWPGSRVSPAPAGHRRCGAHGVTTDRPACGLARLRAPSQTVPSRPGWTPRDVTLPPGAPQPPGFDLGGAVSALGPWERVIAPPVVGHPKVPTGSGSKETRFKCQPRGLAGSPRGHLLHVSWPARGG